MQTRLLARHWKLAIQKACFPIKLSELSLYFFQKWVSMGQMDTPLANTLMQTGQASLCLILQHFPQLANCFHSNEMFGGEEVKINNNVWVNQTN